MKKVLFIDRDGTLILEPADFQIDSLEKLVYYPGVFQYLSKIAKEFDYEFVLVSNQDGLGTDSFPEETFWPAQNKMLEALKNEGITFSEILIDKSLPEENAPTRKPGTAMLNKYIFGNYDLANSFVIGDRITDVQMAQNLGAKSILLNTLEDKNATLITTSWEAIYCYLKKVPRTATIERKTNETAIRIELNLDGKGRAEIETGLPFLNHMLEQIAKHASIDLKIEAQGDLEIDEHHTMEDVALSLGTSFLKALGSKKGIDRYGFLLPMDDCLAQAAIDFGGRPWLVWEVEFKRETVGNIPTEMFQHFFKSFSDEARCNLNIKAEGENEHHKIEAIFKAVAKAIKAAINKNQEFSIPSTKGTL
jgi:imidazoleglycerol-phosphate dehydratase / histidinol-phosphatase